MKNRQSFLAVAFALVAAAGLASAPAATMMTSAQAPPTIPATEELSGTYVDDDAGLEITLPDG